MTRVYSVTLFADHPGPVYGADGYESNFCGAYHVPVDEQRDAGILAELAAANVGTFLDEQGRRARAFFLADEVDEIEARAEAETGLYAVRREREAT